MSPVVVLKFGSSALASPDDLPTAVDEVYRRLRAGTRVLAVVSAFAGETDRLIASAKGVLGDDAAPEAVAAYVATGELQSAALLTGALVRAGVAARLVEPREISLRVEGDPLESDPVSVDAQALRSLWGVHTALVVPGFFGIDSHHRIALLGRGGSDLSALFLAHALSGECHLVKDVPGVFDRDPANVGGGARRYALIPWQEAARVAGPLIQPKALAFAQRHRVPFTVAQANGELETRVAEAAMAGFGAVPEHGARLRVVLLGCGTVGGGVYQRLLAYPDRFELLAVVTRRPDRHIAAGLPTSIASNDLDEALAPDVDLVIECLGGVEPAGSLIDAALAMGKHVVSANKAAITAYWHEVSQHLADPDRRLWCAAAAGGAVPMLETLFALRGRIQEVRGIVSGTCNSVLDALDRGDSFEAAIRAAQAAGFAEADPRRDLSGEDAADKLSLIVHAAFGLHVPPDKIVTRGVDATLVRPTDGTQVWRLMARAVRSNDPLTLSVGPERLPRASVLGQAAGAENRLEIVLDNGKIVRLAGQGAGRWPTTTSVMADVHEIARRHASEC